ALRYACRHENPEVPDAFVQAVNDRLLVHADLVNAAVDIGDPIERLLRRRYVVAPRREYDDRLADIADVDAVLAVGGLELAGAQLVADEEVLGNPLHLLLGHEEMAAPPLLELEKPPALVIDLRVEVVELRPKGVRGIEALEIVDEVGAVEIAVAEVASERRHPGAAEEPARVAHRVLARDARPVRDRRGGEEDRADELGRERGEHHERPATLAVSDHEWLAFSVRMQLVHLAEELDLGGAHGLDRLAGDRLGEEHHEVARVRALERDADLAVHLEAADAGAVAGAWIDDDEGPLRRIGARRPGRRLDERERVVGGALELATVHNDLVIEGKHRRLA